MLNKLVTVEKRFEEVNALLCTSDVASDMEKYTSLMKELKQLTPIVEKYREYKNAEASFNEAKAMLSAGGLDKDFKEMVEEEVETYIYKCTAKCSSDCTFNCFLRRNHGSKLVLSEEFSCKEGEGIRAPACNENENYEEYSVNLCICTFICNIKVSEKHDTGKCGGNKCTGSK